MFCPRCGQTMVEGASFCSSCGYSSATATSAVPGQPAAFTGGSTVAPTSGKAVASLVLGLLSFTFLAAIPAVVFGHLALSEIKKSAGRVGGQGVAIAGLVLGYLGIAMLPFILIIAAIAIPNLLRARIAANEASAVASIRTIDAAQLTYQSSYSAGYASDLQSLGSAGTDCSTRSRSHACLVDDRLASATARPGKHGYTFLVQTTDNGAKYFAKAVPIARNQTGLRQFCSVEDGVIRFDVSGNAISDHDACAALPPLE